MKKTFLSRIKDMALAVGCDPLRILTIYEKIDDQGKAYSVDIHALLEVGVPIISYLCDYFRVATKDIDMMMVGGIPSDAIYEATILLTDPGGKFFNPNNRDYALTN